MTGCMRDIHVYHPSGGEAVQIGCPADLSGIPDGMTSYFSWLRLKMRIAGAVAAQLHQQFSF